MNDEKSKDSRESIQKMPHWYQLNYFWMVNGWLNKQWPMLYATDIDIDTDENKLDSKNDSFGSGVICEQPLNDVIFFLDFYSFLCM